MGYRRTFIHKGAAFSLIEVLVVLALVGMAASFTALMTLRDYGNASFRADRDGIVQALQTAREESMHGSCAGPSCSGPLAHGIHITADGTYAVFQGSTYTSGDAYNELRNVAASTRLSGFADAVFLPLSGNAAASPGSSLTVSDLSGRSSVITIGSEGRISWTD